MREPIRVRKMKEKKLIIKTKRLNIYPLSDREIQDLIDNCPDEGLAAAYGQMLEGCRNNPEQRQWYAPWAMETKEDKKRIGTLGFRGPVSENSVEIGYGIDKEFEGQGYTTEAVKVLLDFAFDGDEVLFVEAEADENNAASIRILEKLGFTRYGQGEEGPRFVKEKPELSYTGIGMCIGTSIGIALGMCVFDNLAIGLSMGLCIGLCLGAGYDSKVKKKISEIKKNKYGL